MLKQWMILLSGLGIDVFFLTSAIDVVEAELWGSNQKAKTWNDA